MLLAFYTENISKFFQKSDYTKMMRSAKIGYVKNLPKIDFRKVYQFFDSPITTLDCGEKCAIYNPNGIPFCCDIFHAVPAVYHQEWNYLQKNSNFWHRWKPNECAGKTTSAEIIRENLPENMILLACRGIPCQREHRALSCRQFPFFPYISDDFRFIGMTYEWEFEQQCWLISNLSQVSATYRQEFINTFDEIFNQWPEEMESYAIKSEEMRTVFLERKLKLPILHRNGKCYLLNPGNERLSQVDPDHYRKFYPYLIRPNTEKSNAPSK